MSSHVSARTTSAHRHPLRRQRSGSPPSADWRLLLCGACALAIVATGCQSSTAPASGAASPNLVGQWVLTGSLATSNGQAGCPRTDATGATFVERGGSMTVGGQAGRYGWQHGYAYPVPGGDSTIAYVNESGSYSSNGTTVTMVPDDPAQFPDATAQLQGDGKSVLQRDGCTFTFERLVSSPP